MTARQGRKTALIVKVVSCITWIPVLVGKILPPGIEKNGIIIDPDES